MAEAGSTHRHNGTGAAASPRAEAPEEAARRLRLERDARRVEVLRALGPNSRRYVEFGLVLRDFAMGTLVGQWRNRQLLREVKKATSISLGLPPSNWDFSYVRSIIAAAVSQSVEPFLDSAVLQGGWTPNGGATVSTFFTNYCYYRFADEYRREYRSERRSVRTLRGPAAEPVLDLGLDASRYLMLPPDRDPEHVALDRAEIRQLLCMATHSRIPEIVFLVAEGCTAKEVGCRLNMSENAVNKALGKFRADVAGIQKGAC